MIVPLLFFLGSGLGLGLALALPGFGDYVMLAGPMAVASLWLVVRAYGRRNDSARSEDRHIIRPRRARGKIKPKWIVIDGSNVMHWKDGTPQIDAVRQVIIKLTNEGYTPGVVFDANAGHKLLGRYQHDYAFGKLLGLPQDRVMVVNKGEPADPTILAAARDLRARIVTNDRYRDWTESHPEIATPGHLIRGGYRDGQLWLDMAEAQPALRAS